MTISKLQAERCEVWASHLEKLDPNKFDILCIVEERSCGTVCCAIGYVPFIPEFKDAGWRALPGTVGDIVLGQPDEELYNWQAIQRFFGVGDFPYFHYEEWRNEGVEPTPKLVAKKLRKYVANNYNGATNES